MALSFRVPLLLLTAGSLFFALVRYATPAVAIEVHIKAAGMAERSFLGANTDGSSAGLRRTAASWFLYRHHSAKACSLQHRSSRKWLTAVNAAPHMPARLALSDRPDFNWLVGEASISYGTGLTLEIHNAAQPTLRFEPVKDALEGEARRKWEIIPT